MPKQSRESGGGRATEGERLTVSVVQLHATIEAAGDSNGLARGDYLKVSYTKTNAERYTPAPED